LFGEAHSCGVLKGKDLDVSITSEVGQEIGLLVDPDVFLLEGFDCIVVCCIEDLDIFDRQLLERAWDGDWDARPRESCIVNLCQRPTWIQMAIRLSLRMFSSISSRLLTTLSS
jgi:hypothetical protein